MIDIVRAYFQQRRAIAGDAPVLGKLIEAVGAPNDLSPVARVRIEEKVLAW